ncbi:MAG: chromate transporter [Sphaerochaetaceae bacterium]|jgi:chromate transporter
MMVLLQLLLSFVQIGLYSFGGGYAALPLIQYQVVDLHKWLTVQEFADVITISQMTPGPIAINAASFVGRKVAGLPGSIVATFGNVLPSLIIVLILAALFARYRSLKVMDGILYGLRPAVVGLIASAGLAILFLALLGDQNFPTTLETLSLFAVILFAFGFTITKFKKINPIFIIIGSGVVTVLASLAGMKI